MEMGESQPNQTERYQIKEAVLSREAVTLAQIHQLLSVVGAMTGVIRQTGGPLDEEFDEYTPEKTEAQIAAENTLINACAKLDQILADPLRWDLSFQQTQEQLYHVSQLASVNFRVKKLQDAEAPHTKFPPALYRTVDGRWMALLGDPDSPGSGVTAIGDSPDEAIRNFDAVFTGRTVTIDPVKWADEVIKTHEQQKLDGSGAGSDINNEAGGQLLGADSGGAPGQDPGWLPDNQRPEAEGDGEGGPGTEGKPA